MPTLLPVSPPTASLDQVLAALAVKTVESGALGPSCNLRHPLWSLGSQLELWSLLLGLLLWPNGLRLLLGTTVLDQAHHDP